MATTLQPNLHPDAFALRSVFDRDLPDGAWWPQNRSLSDQLKRLFGMWPPEAGRIQRVLYSPPDWDDHPRLVDVDGRWVRTGSFPDDDTHLLTLTMLDRNRRAIVVIPPDTTLVEARAILVEIDPSASASLPDEHLDWDNEGGHLSQ